MHAETLARDRMPILQPGVPHPLLRHARPARNAARGLRRVQTPLLDRQQKMFAAATRLESVDFLDKEVLRRAAHHRLQHRPAPCPGLVLCARRLAPFAHARASRHTAWAAIPSPRPRCPSFSLVVALTLTASTSTCRSAAISPRMAAACGPIFGCSHTI